MPYEASRSTYTLPMKSNAPDKEYKLDVKVTG